MNYKYSTDLKQTNVIQVPVSYLRVIRLGDVWHNGKRVPLEYTEKMREKFSSVTITPESAYTSIAGAKGKLDDNLLPFTHHPYHGKATKVHCEFVKLDEDKILVFPHYILLQAYFSKSQYVFQQLFKFGLQFDSIYDPSQSYLTNDGHAYILLKKWTHDIAAPEVARLAFDEVAAKAIRGLSENLSLQCVNNRPVSPKLKFPFEGETTLDVYGKWCPLASGRKVFIVYDILSCDSSYPFSSLEYFRDNPGDENPLNPSTQGENNKDTHLQGRPKPKVPEVGDVDMRPSSEPKNNIDELLVEGRAGTIFNDLTNKYIDKRRQKAHLDDSSPTTYQPFVGGLEGGNTGEGDTQGVSAPVDFRLPDSESENRFIFDHKICRLTLFQQVVNEIENLPRVKNIEYISINRAVTDCNSIFSQFPVTFTEGGRKSTWQYINYYKGFRQEGREKYRLRQALIARITLYTGHEITLIEVQRRVFKVNDGWVELDTTSLLLSTTYYAPSYTENQLSTLLERCSESRGTWEHIAAYNQSQSLSIKHPSNNTIYEGSYADRQIAIIEKNLEFSFA